MFAKCFVEDGGRIMPPLIPSVSISKTELLQLLVALQNSRPTHGHYPEPAARHDNAIRLLQRKIEAAD